MQWLASGCVAIVQLSFSEYVSVLLLFQWLGVFLIYKKYIFSYIQQISILNEPCIACIANISSVHSKHFTPSPWRGHRGMRGSLREQPSLLTPCRLRRDGCFPRLMRGGCIHGLRCGRMVLCVRPLIAPKSNSNSCQVCYRCRTQMKQRAPNYEANQSPNCKGKFKEGHRPFYDKKIEFGVFFYFLKIF